MWHLLVLLPILIALAIGIGVGLRRALEKRVDIFLRVASIFRGADAVGILRDLVRGVVFEVPLRMQSSNLYYYRDYIGGVLRYLYVYVDERDKLGILAKTGQPVYFADGLWLEPRLFFGVSVNLSIADKILQKIAEVAGLGQLAVKVENMASNDPGVLAELFITLTNEIIKNYEKLKLLELAPCIYFGVTAGPDELSYMYLVKLTQKAHRRIDAVDELFQRASTIEALIKETEEVRKLEEVRTRRFAYAIVGAIMALALILAFVTGALQNFMKGAAQMMGFGGAQPTKLTTHAHKPTVPPRPTVTHYTSTHVGTAGGGKPQVVTPTNTTTVVRPKPTEITGKG